METFYKITTQKSLKNVEVMIVKKRLKNCSPLKEAKETPKTKCSIMILNGFFCFKECFGADQ